ncbi:hypothetical protein TOL_0710 [Thalassolituus oleivorans MIL-1]|uniref:Uncharacterized protein n=1 Tax=Thalassolituus oleivorans MIL-1 TaxID=1298593 RepID=M5DNW9_9GAMM|nr:hypothetical protein TOL_0710 [Thalassolituus oleivorans MIL-1]
MGCFHRLRLTALQNLVWTNFARFNGDKFKWHKYQLVTTFMAVSESDSTCRHSTLNKRVESHISLAKTFLPLRTAIPSANSRVLWRRAASLFAGKDILPWALMTRCHGSWLSAGN